MSEQVLDALGSQLGGAITFRKFQQGDIPKCGRLAREAWPPRKSAGRETFPESGMDEYMEYSLGVSNYTDMACSSDQIVGFLFGRIDGLKEEVPHKSLLGELPSMAKSFLQYESMDLHELAFMWTLFLTEVKIRLRMPKSDASIEMFIVDSRYRGTGIGTELVNRFLRRAKDSGARLVTLYTDDRMSNWQFYERRGFKRVGTFYDNITSHYSGQDSTGIIYAMDLSEPKG